MMKARAALAGTFDCLTGDGLGQICELCDGDPPHRPGGPIASAAAAGEILAPMPKMCSISDLPCLCPRQLRCRVPRLRPRHWRCHGGPWTIPSQPPIHPLDAQDVFLTSQIAHRPLPCRLRYSLRAAKVVINGPKQCGASPSFGADSSGPQGNPRYVFDMPHPLENRGSLESMNFPYNPGNQTQG